MTINYLMGHFMRGLVPDCDGTLGFVRYLQKCSDEALDVLLSSALSYRDEDGKELEPRLLAMVLNEYKKRNMFKRRQWMGLPVERS